jgi:hypothetical protein
MNSGDVNREKNSYYYETENDTEDDDDIRSIISSDNYIEDFDNKSEKDFIQDIIISDGLSPTISDKKDTLEELSDDVLFDMNDEKDVISNGYNKPSKLNDIVYEIVNDDENKIPEEEIYNSSLLIQYQVDDNGEVSIPYGIYNECQSTNDGNSFCNQKELTNYKSVMEGSIENKMEKQIDVNEDAVNEDAVNEDAVNEDAVNEDAVNEDAVNEDAVNEDVVNEQVVNEDAVNEQVVNEDAVNEDVVNEQVVNEDAVNEQVVNEDAVNEELPDENIKDGMEIGKEKDLVPKRSLRGTKKNSYKRFNRTKKKLVRRNGIYQEDSKKKKSSRNKRRSSRGKMTRRK